MVPAPLFGFRYYYNLQGGKGNFPFFFFLHVQVYFYEVAQNMLKIFTSGNLVKVVKATIFSKTKI